MATHPHVNFFLKSAICRRSVDRQNCNRCMNHQMKSRMQGDDALSMDVGSPSYSKVVGEGRVLDRFWYSRGIVDDDIRKQLVNASLAEIVDSGVLTMAVSSSSNNKKIDVDNHLDDNDGRGDYVLPGVSSTWDFQPASSSAESNLPKDILEASQRMIDLYRFLGSREDVDVVWMVQREPSLLQMSPQKLARRLLELRVDDAAEGVDVAKLAEKQPSLLLDERKDDGGDERTNDALLEAWQYGLVSGDGSEQWTLHLRELQEYAAHHGDCHVGYRDGDSKTLKRWCKKQRDAYTRGDLPAEKQHMLTSLGFEFDDEHAEWLRWFREYVEVQSREETNLTKPEDFYLINWCAIQRIAKRSKVLPQQREELLTRAGFDWNEPDALS